MGELRFPREHDGFTSAWPGPGERFTSGYEERWQRVAVAVAACGWCPAIESQGSEAGEVVVAYHPREGYRTYLFQIEVPSEQQHVDQLLAAEPGSAQSLVAYLLDHFARVAAEKDGRTSQVANPGAVGCGNCSCGC